MKFNNKSKAFIVLMILIISLVSVGAAFAADADVDDASLAESTDAVAIKETADIEIASSSDETVLSDTEYGNPSDELGIDIDNTNIEMDEGESVNVTGKLYDDDGWNYYSSAVTLYAKYVGDDDAEHSAEIISDENNGKFTLDLSTLSNLNGRDTPYTLTFSVKEDDIYVTSGYNTYGQYPVQVSVTVRGTAVTSPWTIGSTGYDTLEEAIAAANKSADSEIEIIGQPGTYGLNSRVTITGKIVTIKSSSESEAIVIKPATSATAITVSKGSTLKLHNIIFTDFKVQLFDNKGNLTIDNCTIMNGNKTGAGVILSQTGGNGIINNTKIINNTASTLIQNMVGGKLIINNSAFDKNYLTGSSAYPINNNIANLTIENTNFTNGNGTAAGAVYSQGASNLTANNCHFENLTTRNATQYAVGVGAINTAAASTANITGCTFKNITSTNGTLYLKSNNKEVSGNTFEDCTILYNITADTETDITLGQGTTITLVLVDPDSYAGSTISDPTFNVFVKYSEGEYESVAESTGTTYTFTPENIGTSSVYFTIGNIQTNSLTINVIEAPPSPWTIGSTGYDTLEEAVAAANSSADSEIEIIGQPGTYDLNSKIGIKAGKIITIKSASETEAVVIKPVKTITGNLFTIAKGADLTLQNIVFTDFVNVLLYNNGNVTVDNCTIMNGNKSANGVALTNIGNATINNTNICNNNVTTLIANMVNSNLTINNSVIDNHYLVGGTAYAPINNNGANLIVANTNISNSNGTAAGAIYNQGNKPNLTVENCHFENLTAKSATGRSVSAGAISNTVATGTVNITGSTFKNVTAANGTLYLNTANKQVSGNTFEDCTILYNITADTETAITIGQGTAINLVLADPDTYADSTIANPTFNVFVKSGEGEYESVAETTGKTYTFTPENVGAYSVYFTIGDTQTNTLTFNVIEAPKPWNIGETGYATLEAAIEAAQDGDVILGEPGTYKLDSQITFAKSITIAGKDGQVVLDGQGHGMFKIGNGWTNYYVTFENITFTNAGYESDAKEGVIYAQITNLTLNSCNVENNTKDASAASGWNPISGLIYDSGTGDLVLRINNTNFTNNHVIGGQYGANGIVTAQSIIVNITDSNFNNNTVSSSSTYGGSDYYIGYTATGVISILSEQNNRPAYIDNTKFINSTADYGAGIYFHSNHNLTVTNCEFADDTANYKGGAIYDSASDYYAYRFANNTFTNCNPDDVVLANNAAEIDLTQNQIKLGTVDVLNGTDGSLTITYTTPEGEGIANAELNLTLTETYGTVISVIVTTDENGVATYNVVDLTSGLYSTNVYAVQNTTNNASATNNVKIKFDDNSWGNFVIVNPTPIVMTEGESAVVNVSLVDNYNQIITDYNYLMEYLNVSCGDKSIQVKLNENTYLIDLNELGLAESETPYEVTFRMYDPYLGNSYSTTETVTVLLNTDVIIVANNINTTDTEVLNITVPKRGDGVKLIITGEGYGKVVDLDANGPFTYELKDLAAGEYEVTVIYFGDVIVTNTTKFTVSASDISFTADPNATEIKYGETAKITLNGLPEDIDYSAITVTDNNNAIDVEIIDGAFTYTPKASGEHNLTVSFAGDGKYNAFEAKTTVTLSSEGTIVIEPGDNPSEAINNAIANAKAGDTIYLGDNNVYDNLANIQLKDGVSIVGGENTVVKAAEGASSVFVADANASSINIKNLVFEADANNTSLLSITPESMDGGISKVPAINISGVTVNTADGVDAESISILNVNTADEFKPNNDVSVSDNVFNSGVKPVKTNKTSYSGNVAIPKAIQTALTGANTQNVYAIPYTAAQSGKYYTVTLKDANGNALSGKTVKFTLAGKTYNVKTDASGNAKLAVNVFKPGTYTLTATFAGEATLGSSVKQATVKILKNKVKITRNTKKVKKSSKKRTIKFTLKTTTGKKIGIKGVKLTLKINKKTYNAKTNKKGVAKFKVKLPKVKKTYKVQVKFAGNQANAKKTLKTKVKVY